MRESDYSGFEHIYNNLTGKIVTSTEKLILLQIYWFNHSGIKATRKNLSQYVGLSSRAIAWNLARMSARGLVIKELHTSEEGGFLPTVYTLNEKAIFTAREV